MSNSLDDLFLRMLSANEEGDLSLLKSDFDRAEYLQGILTRRATGGGSANDDEYRILRKHFLDRDDLETLLPRWLRNYRNLDQFWSFIKAKFATYQERRDFLHTEFGPLLDYFESHEGSPADQIVTGTLSSLNSTYVVTLWQKALKRKAADPDGAITAAKSLVEAVLKHILDTEKIVYPKDAEVHALYHLVSDFLKLNPEQHQEVLFKKILGGCSSIVTGLGELRNRIGDAHGQGRRQYRASPRHAELAVNLAGTMSLFLVETYLDRKHDEQPHA